MPGVAFLTEGISFRPDKTKKTADWLERIARSEGRTIESLSYVFCSDPFLSSLHKKYLKQSTLTDILTFDYSEGRAIHAEVYISVPRVRENAKKYKQPFSKELRRVMVHGLLHVLGQKDKSVSQSAQMRSKEEACLSLWT